MAWTQYHVTLKDQQFFSVQVCDTRYRLPDDEPDARYHPPDDLAAAGARAHPRWPTSRPQIHNFFDRVITDMISRYGQLTQLHCSDVLDQSSQGEYYIDF